MIKIFRQSNSFKKEYKKLNKSTQRIVDKNLLLFAKNPRHPSLNIKKMKHPDQIWEGRISKGYRFTFQKYRNITYLRRVGKHDILKKP